MYAMIADELGSLGYMLSFFCLQGCYSSIDVLRGNVSFDMIV